MTRWKWAAGAGVVILAFAAGRWSARKPDVTATEKVRTQTVEVAMAREEWVTARDTDTTHDTVRVVYRERTVEPSGRRQERETEVVATSDRAREIVASAGQGERQEAKVERVEVERRVEVRTPLPDWRVGGMVGYGGGLVYGGQVERRVLAPVSVGAWGFGGAGVAGGLSLSLDL